MQTTLRIRGMVCDRCVTVVRRGLESLGLDVSAARLGEVTVRGTLSPDQQRLVADELRAEGFSLLTDRKTDRVEAMKTFVRQLIETGAFSEQKIRLSDAFPARFGVDYPALSTLFVAMEGVSLEKYVLGQRLDKARELLVYTDLSLAEIAFQTGFSSVSHLSNLFKRETGLTPAYFRRVRRGKEHLQQGETV